jgi:hypothetical protein
MWLLSVTTQIYKIIKGDVYEEDKRDGRKKRMNDGE